MPTFFVFSILTVNILRMFTVKIEKTSLRFVTENQTVECKGHCYSWNMKLQSQMFGCLTGGEIPSACRAMRRGRKIAFPTHLTVSGLKFEEIACKNDYCQMAVFFKLICVVV